MYFIESKTHHFLQCGRGQHARPASSEFALEGPVARWLPETRSFGRVASTT